MPDITSPPATPTARQPKYTYEDLFSYHIKLLDLDPVNVNQQQKNQKSTLLKFLEHSKKSIYDEVGSEFTTDFKVYMEQYLNNSGLSPSSIPSQRSHLHKLNKVYNLMVLKNDAPSTFAEALQYYIKLRGITVSTLGKLLNINRKKIYKWMSGVSIPADTSSIVKAEEVLGLSPHTLSSLLPSVKKSMGLSKKTLYGTKLAANLKKEYLLTPLPAKLQMHWHTLIKYKTSIMLPVGIKRNINGHWGTKKDETDAEGSISIGYSYVRSYFGFLALPPNADDKGHSGKGMCTGDFGLEGFLDIGAIEEYLEYMRARSGNYNHYTINFLGFVKMLLHPDFGFIIQYPQLFPDVADLKGKVRAAFDRIAYLKKCITPHAKITRDPNAANKVIINDARPLDILLQMANVAQNYAVAFHGQRKLNISSAIHYRNSLQLNMVISNPLRKKNWRRMSYFSDNTGHIRKDEKGGWFFDIPKEEFKNEKGAAKEDYRVAINEKLWPMIDFYVNECLPILKKKGEEKGKKGKHNNCFFLSNRGRPLGDSGLNSLMYSATHSFCPIPTPGFNYHAYRHIIATDYIKNHPEGFQTVAYILHDTLETVLKNYSHLKVADGFKPWNNYLNDRMEFVKKNNNYSTADKSEIENLMLDLANLKSKLTNADKKKLMEALNG